jgi:hypothetical protein
MKRVFYSLSLSAMALLAQPALAEAEPTCGLTAPVPAPGADAPTVTRAAHDVATLYYPEDLISAVVERQSRTAFEQGVRQSPGGEQVLAELPQLVDVGYQATMSVIRPCVSLMVPTLQNRAAAILAQRLSVGHLRNVAAFYRSDAGRATMAAIARSMRPMQQQQLRDDGSVEPLTRADIRAAVSPDFIRDLTPAQLQGLAAFGDSPHGRAFLALTPQLEQTTVAIVNEMNTGAQAEVETAVQAALADYMRANPPPRRGN